MASQIVDERMRAYYDQGAREYDDWWLGAGRFEGRDRPGWGREVGELTGVIAALPPARVLDVACGTGYLAQHLRGDVVGLDQSASMVELGAARVPGAHVIQGDAVPLPFADGEFDRVFTGHFHGRRPGTGAGRRRDPARRPLVRRRRGALMPR